MQSKNVNFGHLQKFSPKGRIVPFPLPFGITKDDGTFAPAVLHLRFAGDGNPGWLNAITAHAAANPTRLRGIATQGNREVAQLLEARDRALFPKHVVVGWDNVVDSEGQRVPFSVEACSDFFEALPLWILDDVRLFALTASNFVASNIPTPEQAEELAGN